MAATHNGGPEAKRVEMGQQNTVLEKRDSLEPQINKKTLKKNQAIRYIAILSPSQSSK